MTYEERREILSFEVLTIQDISKLFQLPYQSAARKMREIKRRHDRLHSRGKLHILDYLDYIGVSYADRYNLSENLNNTEDFGEDFC